MRTQSPLVLDVREVLESPGVQKTVSFRSPVALETGMASLVGEIDLALTLEAIEGGVLVRGQFAGDYTGSCRRCLEPLRGAFDVTGTELYRPESEVWEEGYVIADLAVDLEPMILDTVGLALPLNPLCREDCKGLCPTCGSDLNQGLCDCAEPVDGRWSALDELRGKLGNR
jgi:uncharacterized protein